MAISASDILFKLSGGTNPGNGAASTPAASLGGYMASTQITDATLHNLFDVVSGDENAASEAEYRCFFVHNNHATLTWEGVKVWISSETSGGATAAISLDTTGVVNYNASSTMSKTVADENTAPSSQTFSAPTTKGTGLTIGDMAPGKVAAVWVRRTAANNGAKDLDGVVIAVAGDTAE